MRTKQITQAMKKCYLIINHKVMKEVADMGALEDLGENRIGTNKYFGINGTNTCIVRVAQNLDYGAYCIINKYIQRTDGKEIDLIKRLRQFSFHMDDSCTGSGRIRTRTGTNELVKKLGYNTKSGTNIESIIHTLRTGKIINQKTGLQVHHEISVFDHRVEVCLLLPEEKHKEIHKRVGQYSRRDKNQSVIENVIEFKCLYHELKSSELYNQVI